MLDRLQAFLTELRTRGQHIDLPEIERRVGHCWTCTRRFSESCAEMTDEEFLQALVAGGPAEAAEKCPGWA
jgi:hypothetical protein